MSRLCFFSYSAKTNCCFTNLRMNLGEDCCCAREANPPELCKGVNCWSPALQRGQPSIHEVSNKVGASGGGCVGMIDIGWVLYWFCVVLLPVFSLV